MDKAGNCITTNRHQQNISKRCVGVYALLHLFDNGNTGQRKCSHNTRTALHFSLIIIIDSVCTYLPRKMLMASCLFTSVKALW